MTKVISKVGNSCGIIFDAPLLELTHLKKGDQVNIEVHEGGVITLTPLHGTIEPAKAAATARRLIRKNSELFRRLA
jgi:antitoxin component of MazEF toxin-antitoxin module